MSLILFNFESNKNSQALAFALDWINEIAKNVDTLHVVSLRCGEYSVEDNVQVYCIEQEKKNKMQTILSIWNILRKIHQKDKNIHGYFVHMAHYFVPFIYPFSLIYKQKIVLWYAHKSVPFTLKIAALLSDKIISISPASIGLKTHKFESVGHGIDTYNRFTMKHFLGNKIQNIITVGRITQVKNIDMIVDAFVSLKREDMYLYIVGDALVQSDNAYLHNIKGTIPQKYKKNIIFTGAIAFEALVDTYAKMDVALNLGDGALDKTIIEPMAMGIPIVTSNESAKELFRHLNNQGVYLLESKKDLQEKLQLLVDTGVCFDRVRLREEILKHHSLSRLAKKIVSEFS